jgi:hypothetical protein
VGRHAALLPLSDAEKTQPYLGMPPGIEVIREGANRRASGFHRWHAAVILVTDGTVAERTAGTALPRAISAEIAPCVGDVTAHA